jgi:iron complex outermembrane receptor protein
LNGSTIAVYDFIVNAWVLTYTEQSDRITTWQSRVIRGQKMRKLRALVVGISVLSLIPHILSAQSASNPTPAANSTDSDSLGEVVVTAERKASGQSAQKVPITVAAVDSQAMEVQHMMNVTDVSRIVPNAQLTPSGTFPGYANFTIRGVGTETTVRSIDPAVNIFQDGMVIAYQAGAVLDTFDLESVQVLSGPQGVLFGRNSSGGAVILTTPLPTHDFHQSAELTIGNFQEVDGRLMLEGPLTSDLFAKVAISDVTNSGYIKNTNGGTFVAAPDNPSGQAPAHPTGYLLGQNDLTIKPTFLYEINDDVTLKLFTQYQHDWDGGGAAQAYTPPGTITGLQTSFGYTPPPLSTFTTNESNTGYTHIQAAHAIPELDWSVAGGTLTTIAAFRTVTYDSTLNVDGTPFNILIFPNNTEENHQESLESRFNGHAGNSIDYLAGIYLFDDKTSVTELRQYDGALVKLPYTSFLDQFNQWHQTDRSGAVYGNIDYHVIDKLTLSAGVRFDSEHKDMDIVPLQPCTGENFTGCPHTFYNGAKTWNGVTPRFVVSYQALEDLLTYVSYNKGFTAGNFNARATSPIDATVPTNPESVTAFEAGMKSQWFDRKLRFNLVAYYDKYNNIQRTVDGEIDNVIYDTLLNAADADIDGFEVQTAVLPVNGLRFDGNMGFTNARFTQISGVTPATPGENPLDLQLDHVPKWTSSVGATYSFNVAPAPGQFTINTGYTYQTAIFTDVQNTPQLRQGAYGLLNASTGYTQGPWRVTLYGRNLANKYYTYTDSIALNYEAYPGQPRMYGVEFAWTH